MRRMGAFLRDDSWLGCDGRGVELSQFSELLVADSRMKKAKELAKTRIVRPTMRTIERAGVEQYRAKTSERFGFANAPGNDSKAVADLESAVSPAVLAVPVSVVSHE